MDGTTRRKWLSSKLGQKGTPSARTCKSLPIRDLNHQLAGILPSEQHQQRFRESLQTLHDVLARFQLTLEGPARQRLHALAITRQVIEHHESLHARAIHQQRKIESRTL